MRGLGTVLAQVLISLVSVDVGLGLGVSVDVVEAA